MPNLEPGSIILVPEVEDNEMPEISKTLAEIEKGSRALASACQNRFKLHASIPARPDVDDDLIISSALRVATLTINGLADALDRAQRERDEAIADLHVTHQKEHKSCVDYQEIIDELTGILELKVGDDILKIAQKRMQTIKNLRAKLHEATFHEDMGR